MSENERMARLEEKVENIVKGVDEIKGMMEGHIDRQEKKFEKLDNKYSAKWVEKLALALTVVVLGGVFGILISLIKQ